MEKEVIVFGTAEEGALEQANVCLEDADKFILMADNHKGYNMPIGGVAAYKNHISPAGVGFDIACGNKAVKLDLKYDDVKDRLQEIAEAIPRFISFGVGRVNKEQIESDLFRDSRWNNIAFFVNNTQLVNKAFAQLGTVGSGNHYIDIFKDEDDYIWIGVHFGSRGLGHAIASEFITRAGGSPNDNMDLAPALLEADTPDFEEYLKCMELAGEYAYAGRDWVVQKVADLIMLEVPFLEEIHNHHNFAWYEEHDGENYYVVRKGATPAFPGQKGFIGGSMGEDAVIIEGVESEASKKALYSTVHGAGRVMSRTKAAGKNKWIDGVPVRDNSGVVDFDTVKKAIQDKGIILIGGGADEAPEVYKRLPEVLEAHQDTIKILHTLTPLVVVMAGADEYDPYKD